MPADKVGPIQHVLGGGEGVTESTEKSGYKPSAADFDDNHIPGTIAPIDDNHPIPFPPQIMEPTNEWIVSNGPNLVVVYAGADGQDPSAGKFAILRDFGMSGKQRVSFVTVPSGGAVTITSAPLGPAAEASMQSAKVRFKTATGRAGTLDLAKNTAVLGG